MREELQSFLIGTVFLDVLFIVALGLTVSRGAGDSGLAARQAMARLGALPIAVQSLHFLEEWKTGFHIRFPELLGLHPWSEALFVGFNLTWIGIFMVSLPGIRTGVRAALFPLWFLGVASVVNCVAHPLLAVAAGGYFPGLWTSPLCGVAGVLVLRAMLEFTHGGRLERKAA